MKFISAMIMIKMCMDLPSFTEAKLPYDVVCKSTASAVIMIDDHNYTIHPPRQCSPSEQYGGNYTFDCLGAQKHFLVSPILNNGTVRGGKGSLRGGKGSKAFTISCTLRPDSSGRLVTLDTNISVVEQFANDTFGAPLISVGLVISSEDPSSASQPVTQMRTSAALGQKLFLAIQSNQTIGEDVFLPMNCSVKSEQNSTLTAQLWSNTSSAKDCIEDDNLIEEFVVYKNGRHFSSSSSTYNLAYAPIYTFFMNDKETEDVTYSCTVMVCPNTAPLNSTCGENLRTMSNQCIRVENGTRPRRRRRRAVDDVRGPLTRTMSATIRIGNPATNKELPIVPIVAGAAGAVTTVTVVVLVVAALLWRPKSEKQDTELQISP